MVPHYYPIILRQTHSNASDRLPEGHENPVQYENLRLAYENKILICVCVSVHTRYFACMRGRAVLYLLCILFVCVCVALSKSEQCKPYEHSDLQEPDVCYFPSKMQMLLYLESTQISEMRREEQACFNLVLPDCYGHTLLRARYGM